MTNFLQDFFDLNMKKGYIKNWHGFCAYSLTLIKKNISENNEIIYNIYIWYNIYDAYIS